MKSILFTVLFCLWSLGAFAADYPVNQIEWIAQFKFHFRDDFCQSSTKNKECMPLTQSQCEEAVGPQIDKCLKTLNIKFPISSLENSIIAGDRIGRCVGRNMQAKIPEKDRAKCKAE